MADTKVQPAPLYNSEFNRVLENIDLEAVHLVSSSFEIASIKVAFSDEAKEIEFEEPDQPRISLQDKRSSLVTTWQMIARAKQTGEIAFKFQATYAVVFALAVSDLDKDALRATTNRLGLSTSYSYLRGIAAATFGAAGLPIPPMPVFTMLPAFGASSAQKITRPRNVSAREKSKRHKTKMGISKGKK